ncbi:hypothetical protein BCCGELA001_04370 [Bradyrhizobium sp. CCGE-LA001]|nr:hypothetical protein BCCGELA001_04370 [Bradyrhizobium sp. CCGE-LA001]
MIAHAFHEGEEPIDAGYRLVGCDAFDLSQNRLEPRDRGSEPVVATLFGKFNNLCVHARGLAGIRLRPLR